MSSEKMKAVHQNFNQNELRNAVLQPLAAAPSTPLEGQFYYNTVDKTTYQWDGTAWLDLGVQGGGGATNLGATLSPTQTVITSDTGTDATIPAADSTNAGVMTKDMFDKLGGITDGADVTNATNVEAAGAVMESDTSTVDMGFVTDEDDMVSDLDTKVPTQQSVKAYVDTGLTAKADSSALSDVAFSGDVMDLSGIDNDTALTADSGTSVPTQHAVKTYVDGILGAADAMIFKGVIDASSNPNYPAATTGDFYKISVAGKIGGASGIDVQVGDAIIATADNAGGTQASVGTIWSILQSNVDRATTTVLGLAEYATQAEAQARSSTTVALTPASVADFARTLNGLIGDNSTTDIVVTHGLGNRWVNAQVYDASTGAEIDCAVECTSTTQVTFGFSVAPTTGQYHYVIAG